MSHEQGKSLQTLVPTSDGSLTLLHTGLNQTYHSVNGALQEAQHVFLQQGLQYFLRQSGTATARVLEIGFGTGLNFLVSAAYCLQNGISLTYTGVEPFPLNRETLRESEYGRLLPGTGNWERFLSWYPGGQPFYLTGEQQAAGNHDNLREPERLGEQPGAPKPRKLGEQPEMGEQPEPGKRAKSGEADAITSELVRLELLQQKVLQTGPLPPADVIYFDAFAPATQPEMWTQEVISHVTSSLEGGGVFVSYSITGNLKRMLKGLGFSVEKPKGAAGKREMIRAVKNTPL